MSITCFQIYVGFKRNKPDNFKDILTLQQTDENVLIKMQGGVTNSQ